jgi:hypothetical protein
VKLRALTTLVTMSAASVASGATFTWTGGPGNWSDASKWGGAAPSGGSDVMIDGGNGASSSVILNVNASVGTLTLDAGDVLTFSGSGRSLAITGGTLLNDGQIFMTDSGSGVQSLFIGGVVALAGSGDLVFQTDDDNLVQPSINGATDVMLVGVNQRITTTSATTTRSQLRVRFENDGLIEANEGGLTVSSHSPKLNRSLMRAVGGGMLRFEGVTVDNRMGEIEAGADSIVSYDAAVIDGGELTGTGVHDVGTGDLTLLGTTVPVTLATGSQLHMLGDNSRFTRMFGTIVNNGTILMEDTGSGTNQILIANTVNLTGNGRVEFRGSEHNQVDPSVNGAIDMLNIGAGQTLAALSGTTITTTLNSRFTNGGIIEADGGTLNIGGNGPKENNNLIRARNGGGVRIAGVTVDNADGTIDADASSAVTYEGVTVTGGSLTGAGQHVVGTSDLILNGVTSPVTLGGGSTLTMIGANNRFTRLQGAIVNNGTMILEDTGSGTNQILIANSVSLSGAGTILFRGTENNQIDPIVNGATDILMIGANQVVTTSDNTTLASLINARFVNNGLIEANAGELQIAGNSPKENNAVIRSRNGGNLQLSSVTVENADGAIDAGDGSTITYQNVIVQGGALGGAGTHVVGTSDLRLIGASNPVSIGEDATIELVGANSRALRLEGAIVHDGEIVVQDTGSGSNQLLIANAVNMTGSGIIRLIGNEHNTIIPAINGATDILNLGPGISIIASATTFDSAITTRFANDGLIEVEGGQFDVSNGSLRQNSGVMRARNAATLRINGGTLNNAGGEIDVEAGSTLTLVSTTINGGVIYLAGDLTTSGTNNLGTTLKPGGEVPGTLNIAGPAPVLTESNVIELDLGGATPGVQHDAMQYNAQARFGGTLRVRAVNGFVPSVGDRFVIANYPSHLTTARFTNFESVGFPGLLTVRVDYQSNRAELVIVRVGDINCDGEITVSDIAPMVLALTQPDQFPIQFPNCEFFDADINGDGIISVNDIAPFVALLTGG